MTIRKESPGVIDVALLFAVLRIQMMHEALEQGRRAFTTPTTPLNFFTIIALLSSYGSERLRYQG